MANTLADVHAGDDVQRVAVRNPSRQRIAPRVQIGFLQHVPGLGDRGHVRQTENELGQFPLGRFAGAGVRFQLGGGPQIHGNVGRVQK